MSRPETSVVSNYQIYTEYTNFFTHPSVRYCVYTYTHAQTFPLRVILRRTLERERERDRLENTAKNPDSLPRWKKIFRHRDKGAPLIPLDSKSVSRVLVFSSILKYNISAERNNHQKKKKNGMKTGDRDR